ncbi:hypothetical protein B0O99DRAFT_77128 [Bisporella sp. PMI_857]|nr:hypothetical protein B0O99DRAFT_77128 [Bisporella sp. PMI_857]
MRPRPSASVSTKNISSVPLRTPATLSRDNNISRSLVGVDGAKDDTVDPQRALNILRKSIETQPYSSISQREMADLIKKIEDVVLREKLYGSSSSDNGEVTIPSTMSDSISNSEIINLEDSTDATSVSSTPRLTAEEIPNVEPAEAQTVHKQNCPHCGNRPNYYCSRSDCGYFAHTRGDAKRHEEGEKHYPQARFMCCECPLSQADLNKNGRPVCEFCEVICMDFRLLRAHYLRCSHAKDRGKTFGRKDHFIQHLREEHGIPNDTLLVAGSRYPISSNWPKQCSRCSKTFQTWEERMSHLAEHAEEDFHPRGFGKKPKDDDDDDDDDDNKDDYHGGGRFHGKRAGRQFDTAMPMQHKQASSSGNNNHSSHGNYQSRTEAVLSDISNLEKPSRKPSLTLERYLNDTESPIPIPLRYQKCEGQEHSCHESSGTSARAHQRASVIKAWQAPQQLKLPASLQLKPRPYYPVPIPSNKQNKELQLYINYKREVELELNTTSTANDSFSSITTESILSKHCKTTTPISTSTYNGATDVYPVVSFDNSQSSLSTKNQLRELISYNKRNDKKRTRRLSPEARAKAALIRCLGSCSICRSRRLPVSKF